MTFLTCHLVLNVRVRKQKQKKKFKKRYFFFYETMLNVSSNITNYYLIDSIRHPHRPSLSHTNERRGKQRSPEDSVA